MYSIISISRGRYLYIRDNQSKDYWSASWQPVGKDLDRYDSQCRHGLGYTKMTASYAGIRSEALYYVPLGKTYEVWGLTVANESSESRELTLNRIRRIYQSQQLRAGSGQSSVLSFYNQDAVPE